jgi:hypothetical protein
LPLLAIIAMVTRSPSTLALNCFASALEIAGKAGKPSVSGSGRSAKCTGGVPVLPLAAGEAQSPDHPFYVCQSSWIHIVCFAHASVTNMLPVQSKCLVAIARLDLLSMHSMKACQLRVHQLIPRVHRLIHQAYLVPKQTYNGKKTIPAASYGNPIYGQVENKLTTSSASQ